MKIVYVDTTKNENNEIGSKTDDNFYLPMFGSIMDIKNEKYELRNVAEDSLNKVVYLYLVKH
jgi:hypothetical protein